MEERNAVGYEIAPLLHRYFREARADFFGQCLAFLRAQAPEPRGGGGYAIYRAQRCAPLTICTGKQMSAFGEPMRRDSSGPSLPAAHLCPAALLCSLGHMASPTEPDEQRRLKDNLQDEVDGAAVYNALADA